MTDQDSLNAAYEAWVKAALTRARLFRGVSIIIGNTVFPLGAAVRMVVAPPATDDGAPA